MSRTKLPQNILESLIKPEDEALVSIRHAAALLGIGADTIRNWDIPEKFSSHQPIVYSLKDVIKAYCEKKDLKIERLKVKVIELDDNTIDWTQHLKRELTRTAELKNAQLDLKLIAYLPVQQYLLNLTQQFLSSIDEIPARVSPKVIGCKDQQDAFLLLRDEMRFVKNVLADISLDAYENKPIGIETEAPSGFKYNVDTDTFVRDESKLEQEE